jgi:hypothetical protein
MAMETYTLRIEEAENGEGITADVYDYDGLIEESTWIDYAEYGLRSQRDEDTPEPREQEMNVDTMTMNLQVERDGEAFSIQVLGDDETLATERIVDAEWGLAGE